MSQVLGTLFTVCLLTEKKPNYLKALSNIVNKLPKQVQVTELPAVSTEQPAAVTARSFSHRTRISVARGCWHFTWNCGKARKTSALMWSCCFFVAVQLLSLLLEALTYPDKGVQLSTLSCLQPVLVNPPPVLIQQLEALVNRLLALTSSPAMVSEIYSIYRMYLCYLHESEVKLVSAVLANSAKEYSLLYKSITV